MASSFLHNCEMVANWTTTSQSGVARTFRSVFRYGCNTGGGFVFSANGIAAQLYTTILAGVVAQMSNLYRLASITARLMDDSTLLPVTATVSGVPATGAISGDALPQDMAVVMQLKTGLRGKSYRGSKHYPGIPEVSTTREEIVGGALTAWQALKAPHATALVEGANTWSPIIVNGVQSQLVNPTNIVATVVTSGKLNNTIGTERRRREATVTS